MELDHSCPDLISELPQDIIEVILSKLLIRDAVRTCILSRSWRYKWTSMTRILVDEKILKRQMVPFINGFWSMHVGPIHKFALRTNCYEYDFLEVDRWIPYVCQKDVKELTLQLGNLCQNDVRAPPCIFSCKNLARLELLYPCVWEPPPSFVGFSCMKHLALRYVSIPRKEFERLISSCPLLESLTLAYTASSELTIRAPNLKCLNVGGGFIGIRLENTPLLVDLTVSLFRSKSIFEDSPSYNFLEKLLGGIPKLERLRGQYNFTHCLTAGCGGRRFITYEFLKHIELSSLFVDNPKKVLVALHLIFSSPNLQELHIKGRKSYPYEKIKDPFLDYFKDPFLANRTLDRLELVKISGNPNELAFLKLILFLLRRLPSLVMMIIEPSDCRFVNEGRRQLVSNFPRASQKASIVIS